MGVDLLGAPAGQAGATKDRRGRGHEGAGQARDEGVQGPARDDDRDLHAEIDEAFDGADTFFPAWKKDEWEEQNRELHRPDGREKYSFSFVHYVRRFD